MAKADRQARRAARREERAARRAGRQDNKANRRAARLERQQGRQGFLSGIIGDKGLGGLIDSAGDAFGGGGAPPPTKTGEGGEGGIGGMSTTTLALIGLGAYMLMKKK